MKPLSEFYKNSTYLDGHEGRCKRCRKDYQKTYCEINIENRRQSAHKYYQEHKAERSIYYKIWRTENQELKAQYDREWRKSHPERMKIQRKTENARRRARLVNAEGKYTIDEWLNIKAKYDYTCLSCGRSEPEVKITPDHVIPLASGGNNNIENIQPLCWGCNARKQNQIIDYRYD